MLRISLQKSTLCIGFATLLSLVSCIKANDMNTQKTTDQAASAKTNADTLSKLAVPSDEIDPVFDPQVFSYRLKGGETKRYQLTVETAPTDSRNHVTVNGIQLPADFTTQPISLAAATNIISIAVLDPNDTVKNTYTITVERAVELADNVLDDLAVSTGTIVPNFNSEILDYKLTVVANFQVLTISPLLAYPEGAALLINDKVYSVGETSYDFNLTTGINNFKIVVTGQSGKSRTYTLEVNKIGS